jgi:hypothetical protein
MGAAASLLRLEAANGNAVVIVWRHYAETDEQALVRWLAEHPGQDPKGAGNLLVIEGKPSLPET